MAAPVTLALRKALRSRPLAPAILSLRFLRAWCALECRECIGGLLDSGRRFEADNETHLAIFLSELAIP